MEDLLQLPVDVLQKRLDNCEDYRERRRLRSALKTMKPEVSRPSLLSVQSLEVSPEVDKENNSKNKLPDKINSHQHEEQGHPAHHHHHNHQHALVHDDDENHNNPVSSHDCHDETGVASIHLFEAMLKETTDLSKRRELRKLLRDMHKQSEESASMCFDGKAPVNEICIDKDVLKDASDEPEGEDANEIRAHIDCIKGPTNRHVYHVTKTEKCDEHEEIVSHCTVVHTHGEDFEKTDTTVTRNRINKRSGSVQVHTGSFLTVKRLDAASGNVQIQRDLSFELEAQSATAGTTSRDIFAAQTVVDKKANLNQITECDEEEEEEEAIPPNHLEFTSKLKTETHLSSGDELHLTCQLELVNDFHHNLFDAAINWKREDDTLQHGKNGFLISKTLTKNSRGLLLELRKHNVDTFDEGQYVMEYEASWNPGESIMRTDTYVEVAPAPKKDSAKPASISAASAQGTGNGTVTPVMVPPSTNGQKLSQDGPEVLGKSKESNGPSSSPQMTASSLPHATISTHRLESHNLTNSKPSTVCISPPVADKPIVPAPTVTSQKDVLTDKMSHEAPKSSAAASKPLVATRSSAAAATYLANSLIDRGTAGAVRVQVQHQTSTQEEPEVEEATQFWQKGNPSAAKSAMSAFKAMDKQANPEGTAAKPNFMSGKKPAGSTSTNNPAAVKQLLLEWCKDKTKGYEGVNVQNFSGSWGDGLAFCALIHHFFPDSFDFNALKKENRRENFKLAFDTAEQRAGVAQLLDVEDMVMMKNPDWKCVFCYIQTFYQKLRNHEANKLNSA